MSKITLIIEKNDGMLWGRVEGKGWMPTPFGETFVELINNLKELVADHITHEGANDKKWNNIDWNKTEFDVQYNLASFFTEFDYLNLSGIAKRAGINRSLLNQYAAGIKHPSISQAKKIEETIHELANDMKNVTMTA